MASTNYTAPLWQWGLLPLIAVYLTVAGFFFARLERVHNEVWQQLGSPSLFQGRRPIWEAWPVIVFIFSGRYKSLNDGALQPYIWAIRILLIATLAYFAATLVFSPGATHFRIRL